MISMKARMEERVGVVSLLKLVIAQDKFIYNPLATLNCVNGG